jgi:uncharacterized protein (TIGR03083 family)
VDTVTTNRQRYLTALFGLDAVIRRVPGDAWGNASPCEGWTARDVVDHNLFLIRTVQGMAEGESAAVVRTADDGLFPAPADGYSLAPWLPFTTLQADDDPIEVWGRHFRAMASALDTVEPKTTRSTSLWGHETLEEFLAWLFYDPIVHTWDLATATGLPPIVDGALAQEGIEYISRHEDLLRQPMVLGDAVATESQDPLERLLAFCGRDVDAST